MRPVSLPASNHSLVLIVKPYQMMDPYTQNFRGAAVMQTCHPFLKAELHVHQVLRASLCDAFASADHVLFILPHDIGTCHQHN